MATPVTPAVPAAAAPAAPSAPASSAPSGAAPSTPSIPAAPAASPAPAGAAPAAAPAEPKASEFAQGEEGVVQWMQARDKWAQENPDAASAAAEARKQETAEPAAASGAQPAEPAAEPKPAEEPKPGEQPAGGAPAEPAAAMPEAWGKLIEGDAALKAALEGNQEAYKLAMDNARELEGLRPVAEIFPTREEAEFAQGYANTMIDLRHNFLLGINDPEARELGWNGLRQQFIETDEKGAPVRDAEGNPVYGKDYDVGLLTPATAEKLSALKSSTKTKLDELKQRVEKGVYPSAEAKAADEALLRDADLQDAAIDLVMDIVKGQSGPAPLPDLPEDATPAQRAFQEQLKAERDKLDGDKRASGQAATTQRARQFETDMRLEWQKGVGEMIDAEIEAMRGRGEYIPDYILSRKFIDPATKQPTEIAALAMEILNDFDSMFYGPKAVPKLNDRVKALQMKGEAGKQQRLEEYAQMRAKHLPQLIRKHVKLIQDGIRESQEKETQRRTEMGKLARPEPQTATSAGPTPVLTADQVEQKVQETVRKDPKWQQGSGEDRAAIEMAARTRIRFGY